MIRFSNKASSDIDSILDYSFINFGSDAMLKYHQSLETCLETLDKNPDLGIEIEHINSDYLCFEHRMNMMFYKKTNDDIVIIRILHKSMDVPKHFS